METYENPDLKNEVKKDTQLKEWLVNYVGNSLKPENGNITVEMIVEVMSKEFPEFLLAVAEENFIRGYEQALTDVEAELPQKKTKKKKR